MNPVRPCVRSRPFDVRVRDATRKQLRTHFPVGLDEEIVYPTVNPKRWYRLNVEMANPLEEAKLRPSRTVLYRF